MELDGQTGVIGVPTAPFIVAFELVGAHGNADTILRTSAERLREVLEDCKGRDRLDGWLHWDQWLLLCAEPNGTSKSWVYDDGVVDEATWREAVEGTPEKYDHVVLASGTWGELDIAAPASSPSEREVRSVSAWIESSASRVHENATMLLNELLVAAAMPGVASGYVHVDSCRDPFSEVVTEASQLATDDFTIAVHGYYWAVLLTDRHLAALGGRDRVRQEAPCARIDDVPGRPGALICVLTDSPAGLNAELVRRWRTYLRPVLRSGYPASQGPSSWDHAPKPERSLPPFDRPMWLFEGRPAPAGARFILQGGLESDGGNLPVTWADPVGPLARPTLSILTSRTFRRAEHAPAVEAAVHAWIVTGLAGRLFGANGIVGDVTNIKWSADPTGSDSLSFQIDLGDCEPPAVVERLAALLRELNFATGHDILDRVRVT